MELEFSVSNGKSYLELPSEALITKSSLCFQCLHNPRSRSIKRPQSVEILLPGVSCLTQIFIKIFLKSTFLVPVAHWVTRILLKTSLVPSKVPTKPFLEHCFLIFKPLWDGWRRASLPILQMRKLAQVMSRPCSHGEHGELWKQVAPFRSFCLPPLKRSKGLWVCRVLTALTLYSSVVN